jgi:hypothetical protein
MEGWRVARTRRRSTCPARVALSTAAAAILFLAAVGLSACAKGLVSDVAPAASYAETETQWHDASIGETVELSMPERDVKLAVTLEKIVRPAPADLSSYFGDSPEEGDEFAEFRLRITNLGAAPYEFDPNLNYIESTAAGGPFWGLEPDSDFHHPERLAAGATQTGSVVLPILKAGDVWDFKLQISGPDAAQGARWAEDAEAIPWIFDWSADDVAWSDAEIGEPVRLPGRTPGCELEVTLVRYKFQSSAMGKRVKCSLLIENVGTAPYGAGQGDRSTLGIFEKRRSSESGEEFMGADDPELTLIIRPGERYGHAFFQYPDGSKGPLEFYFATEGPDGWAGGRWRLR